MGNWVTEADKPVPLQGTARWSPRCKGHRGVRISVVAKKQKRLRIQPQVMGETAGGFLSPDGHERAKTGSQTSVEKCGAYEKVRSSEKPPSHKYVQLCSAK